MEEDLADRARLQQQVVDSGTELGVLESSLAQLAFSTGQMLGEVQDRLAAAEAMAWEATEEAVAVLPHATRTLSFPRPVEMTR